MTNQAECELRVDVELSTGNKYHTTYKGFRITDEFGEYQLRTIGALTSNIGECPTLLAKL